ncbi:hypothetical protein [Mesorhizobium sp. M7A.F.Ca.US.011.01.1.1]|uniref:hypothetical protein n=1 Tax=Mesorhizobium sp. M7A.F.Ca.US.011.01.1.1 TaxID=2496741 RepID=UPI0013E2D1D8|nr:hypothetical protein [Mesorhizobium sp. M7A.F.Ca.US.011.01.1.1]
MAAEPQLPVSVGKHELPDDERIETGIENRKLRDRVLAALQKLPGTSDHRHAAVKQKQ